MYLFGHIGITAGISKACELYLSQLKPGVVGGSEGSSRNTDNAMSDWIGRIDYRLVMIGSVLPDIIDKPIFLIFGDEIILSGRDYAHTLLFNLALLLGGLILFRYRKSWMLIIALSSILHLVFDHMWESPKILLWPLLGPLPGLETTGRIYTWWHSIFTVPAVYIPEIIGLLILAVFLYRLIRRRRVTGFITGGVIE